MIFQVSRKFVHTVFASIIIRLVFFVASNKQCVNNEYPEAVYLFILVADDFLGLL